MADARIGWAYVRQQVWIWGTYITGILLCWEYREYREYTVDDQQEYSNAQILIMRQRVLSFSHFVSAFVYSHHFSQRNSSSGLDCASAVGGFFSNHEMDNGQA